MGLAKYINFYLAGSVFLYLLFAGIFIADEQDKKEIYRIQKQQILESEYLVALNGYKVLAGFVFDQLVNSPQVQTLMARASSHPEDRDRLRQELFTQFSPLYGQLVALHFRQLHFHLPDSSSFLRFHRPDKFGDSLVGVQETVVAANTSLKRVSAFEEGRIFNGFRFVYPILYGQHHVGSVEISISSFALIDDLSRIFGKQYRFMLDRHVVEAKVFADELNNYEACLLSPDFLYDREEGSPIVDTQVDIQKLIIQDLKRSIAQEINIKLKAWQPVVHLARLGGKGYVVSLMPIANFKGEYVAYLVSFEEDGNHLTMARNFMLILVFLTLLFTGGLVFFLHIARTNKKLKVLSSTDFLTGISNRGRGYELLRREHDRALRYDSSYSLIMFDLDRFKKVNDTYGHPVGDYVLKKIADLVADLTRRTDSFCRWGGEEFLLLMPETSVENALAFAEKIRHRISAYDFKYVGTVTVSLGVVEFSGETAAVDEMIIRVDQALYEAKQSGRNRVCQYSPPQGSRK